MTPEELRQSRIADLQLKLVDPITKQPRREGRPGFKENVAMIKAQLAALEAADGFRDKETGEFVTLEHAIQNPESTERAGLTDG